MHTLIGVHHYFEKFRSRKTKKSHMVGSISSFSILSGSRMKLMEMEMTLPAILSIIIFIFQTSQPELLLFNFE